MNFDLCIGEEGNVFWEFGDEKERDVAFDNLIASHGWKPEWSKKFGARQIHFDFMAMPIVYRFKCSFREARLT